MRSRILFILAALLLFLLLPACLVTSAHAYEPIPPSWLEEFLEHPPGVPPPPTIETPPDETPPDTVIDEVSASRGHRSVKLSFASTEEGSSFACRFDAHEAFGCAAPLVLRHLGPGLHEVLVAAIDAAGNVDPTPATYRFRVIAN